MQRGCMGLMRLALLRASAKGDSHQVAPGEVRPRPLTRAGGIACVSKRRCMRVLLSEEERALRAHHAGELVPVAEAPVLVWVAGACNDVAALMLDRPAIRLHLHQKQHA